MARKLFGLFAVLVAVPAACVAYCTDIELDTGKIQGSSRNGIAHFFGVPFAAPPVGDLRWQPPQPHDSWDGVRETKKYSKACAQETDTYTKITNMSEDCLYLNMWIPEEACLDPAKKYPVMVFFYGGSYVTGSAMFPVYDGEAFVSLRKDVILITTNYRLGVFGYLGSDRLRASDKSTGNFGLQDQRAALQFVQRNAKALHADPSRVTIFGQSAGAGSVSNHLVAPRSAGLFSGAIAESGPFSDWVDMPMYIAEEKFNHLLTITNCTNAENIPKCLRNISAERLIKDKVRCSESLIDWGPVVDGVELPDRAKNLARDGKAHDVPVIMGVNRNEGTLLANFDKKGNESELDAKLAQQFNPQDVVALKKMYPVSDFKAKHGGSAAWWAYTTIGGDANMVCPALRSIRYLSASGRKSPAYGYFFEYELQALHIIEDVSDSPFGVCHCSELPLVFRLDEGLITKGEVELSNTVCGVWHDLAKLGKTTESVGWEPYSAANGTVVWNVKDDKASLTMQSNFKQSLCDFWDNVKILDTSIWGFCSPSKNNNSSL